MKIYTKGGDQGQTSLLGGTRVSKSNVRIHAYGTVDELNAHLGMLGDFTTNKSRQSFIRAVQATLFTIGSHLAADPDKNTMSLPEISEQDVDMLEKAMDEMDQHLPPLKSFVLPGGHQEVSYCHVARCVCRRAERMVIELTAHSPVDALIIKYLNRLSDYLFVLSRLMANELGAEEIPWNPKS